MRIPQALKDIAKEVAATIIGSKPQLVIPHKTREKMSLKELTVRDIQDVFQHGEQRADKKGSLFFVKEYYTEVIGFYFVRSSKTGDYIVTGVWKHPRE
jgi:bifunctional DNA-binding transcriptional regulator/antitoxin component of YhaV-PrlF toxin-antitoxin module